MTSETETTMNTPTKRVPLPLTLNPIPTTRDGYRFSLPDWFGRGIPLAGIVTAADLRQWRDEIDRALAPDDERPTYRLVHVSQDGTVTTCADAITLRARHGYRFDAQTNQGMGGHERLTAALAAQIIADELKGER